MASLLEAEGTTHSVRYGSPRGGRSAPEMLLLIRFNVGVSLYECKYKLLHLI